MSDSTSTQAPTIHHEDTGGDGRPVVLIHGWPLSGASWKDTVPALTDAGYRVITYDRRGFGQSSPAPDGRYDYDALASDLDSLLTALDLTDVTLVGFSMGGGEVARYVGNHGTDRLRSIAFLGAIPPWLLKSDENPDGGLPREDAEQMQQDLRADREEFLDEFMTNFFSADGDLKVTEDQRQDALGMAAQADLDAMTSCIESWLTNFTGDLAKVTVPTLVVHGDSDAIVPFEVSGKRTHEQVAGSDLVVIEDGPHGFLASHPDQVNTALLDFLQK
ncbi:pimeloyl-ACP methyl ester carboxylesterase [Knoellia remsis]|uniref:Pimeloyl-ACP methyl ester carboxylesterase n=1 Tax=Knoellia remsis TaxID=407159 RepID=A0A2T0V0X2_9MICO|nr:alpha/beta hydrolase [Knoellia remsis]PRY63839.1 pimeloyl-ACP methyl ester carboxylesterase [Knoellia remsis]